MNDTEKKTSKKAIHLLTQYNKHSKTKTKQQSKKKITTQTTKTSKKQTNTANKQTNKKKAKSERATFIQHELPNKCVGHSHFMLN